MYKKVKPAIFLFTSSTCKMFSKIHQSLRLKWKAPVETKPGQCNTEIEKRATHQPCGQQSVINKVTIPPRKLDLTIPPRKLDLVLVTLMRGRKSQREILYWLGPSIYLNICFNDNMTYNVPIKFYPQKVTFQSVVEQSRSL